MNNDECQKAHESYELKCAGELSTFDSKGDSSKGEILKAASGTSASEEGSKTEEIPCSFQV